jgi:hypothetical protein
MSRNITLADRLREVFLNGYWIANTNYKDQIQSCTWQQASQKNGTFNTIAALTFHINYYLNGLLNAFENGKLEISDKFSFEAPPINSEADWTILANELLNNAEKFANVVEQMEDSRFDQPFIDPKYGTILRNIEGVLEHSYYHLGQIALLRKMTLQQEQ